PGGWREWVGPQGQIIGINHYGASASAEVLFEKFGFTAEAVVEAARQSITDASA
ncbi:MAG TPA: hypothetical protein IAA98_01600, partial [Candidatus Avipropionibacterium avicola]|nr:hypothetical protein [Candidatus Avipropionibacterium avicola]